MSEFSVIAGAIEDMAGRMDAISPGAADLHRGLGGHAGAAAQTPVHGALSGLMAQWGAVLPHFGLAGDRLSAAMRGAARTYVAADAAVARASAEHHDE